MLPVRIRNFTSRVRAPPRYRHPLLTAEQVKDGIISQNATFPQQFSGETCECLVLVADAYKTSRLRLRLKDAEPQRASSRSSQVSISWLLCPSTFALANSIYPRMI